MELEPQVFPKYNPLPNLVKGLSMLKRVGILQEVKVVELVIEKFEEAGVFIKTRDDLAFILNFLLEKNILVGEKLEDESRILYLSEELELYGN